MSAEEFGNPQTARAIIESLPARFLGDEANEDQASVIHLKISGEQGGDFTININNGSCHLEEGLLGEATCVVSAEDMLYADIELGKRKPHRALMTGKLKISNLLEMMEFMSLFKRLF